MNGKFDDKQKQAGDPVTGMLLFLRDILEPYNLARETDVWINLDRIFRLYNITSKEAVLQHKLLIAPVIVKSKQEQEQFFLILQNYEQAVGQNILVRERVQKKRSKRYHLISSSGFLLITYLIYLLTSLYGTSGESTALDILKIREVRYKERDLVVFTSPITRANDGYFRWDFGDGTPTIESNDSLVTHRYIKEGAFNVTVTRFNEKKRAVATGQSTVTIEPACHILPSFEIEHLSGNRQGKIVLKNTTVSDTGCVNHFVWNFGDRTSTVITNSNSDIVTHQYNNPGLYRITLSAVTKATNSKTIHTSTVLAIDTVQVIDIKDFSPKRISTNVASQSMLYWISIFTASLLIGAFCTYMIYYYRIRRRQKANIIFDEKFGKYHYDNYFTFEYPDKSNAIYFEKADDILSKLALHQKESSNTLHITDSLWATVRKAGFPVIRFAESKKRLEYLILIDLGLGNDQQAALFDALAYALKRKGVHFVKYYFRSLPDYLAEQKDLKDAVNLSVIARKYFSAPLIIFSNGYGFLDHFAHAERFATGNHLSNFLKMWPKRVLITPVPRSQWSIDERRLFSIIPLYPATERGLEGVIKAMESQPGREPLIPREKQDDYINYPVHNNLADYKHLFRNDRKLLIWLYALCIEDTINWNITITVGHALEKYYEKSSGSQLVTWSNLLKLASVEWLQTGYLPGSHRNELLEQLWQEPEGMIIMQVVSKALKNLSEEIKVPEGSVLALQKKIKESVLQQWINGNNKEEIRYLQERNLIDAITVRQLQQNKALNRKPTFARAISNPILIYIMLTILLYWLATTKFVSEPIQNKFPPKTSVDSLAYYNNLACNAMTPDSNAENNPFTNAQLARYYLQKASVFNDTSEILRNNFRVLTYKVAKDLYDQKNFSDAIDSFGTIAATTDSLAIGAMCAKAIAFSMIGQNDSCCALFQEISKFGFWRLILPWGYTTLYSICPTGIMRAKTKLTFYLSYPKEVQPGQTYEVSTFFSIDSMFADNEKYIEKISVYVWKKHPENIIIPFFSYPTIASSGINEINYLDIQLDDPVNNLKIIEDTVHPTPYSTNLISLNKWEITPINTEQLGLLNVTLSRQDESPAYSIGTNLPLLININSNKLSFFEKIYYYKYFSVFVLLAGFFVTVFGGDYLRRRWIVKKKV